MTADEFFWWWVERQTGITQEALRNDPMMQQIVKEEADRRNLELIDRIMAEFRRREEQAVQPSQDNHCSPHETSTPHRPEERQPVTEAGITVAEAARRLGCSGSKAYRLFNGGDLTGHKVGDKIVIDPASVNAYKERHSNRGTAPPTHPEPSERRRRFRHLDL